MIKKRIIASILINNGHAVQSFGYEQYLPLGDPKILVENLARWKVDEIVITDISCSRTQSSIDFDLISDVANISKGTPIIYGGGITSSKEASLVIQSGADRIVIENAFVKNKLIPEEVAGEIGSQAVIMSLPIIIKDNNTFYYDYINKKNIQLSTLETLINNPFISEFLITDVKNEGSIYEVFNMELIENSFFENLDIICNGGIHSNEICNTLLNKNNVKAIMIGNKLNHSELSYLNIKNKVSTRAQNHLRF